MKTEDEEMKSEGNEDVVNVMGAVPA